MLLPVGIMLYIAKWLFRVITDLIQPLTNLMIKSNGLPEALGDFVVLLLLGFICFVVGWLVTTGSGKWFHAKFDSVLIKIAPGYRILKEIVEQFLGDSDSSPFKNGEVALVQIFGKDNPVTVTAIVTARSDKTASVFALTSPNPSSGVVYHVPLDLVEFRPDIAIDSCLRTVVALGAGSPQLFGWPSESAKSPSENVE